MSLGRLLLVAALVVAGIWVFKYSGLISPKPAEQGSASPIQKARDAARVAGERSAAAGDAQAVVDGAPAAGVTENMTPDQVRALLGAPDEIVSETSELGTPRERWTYRAAGKSVVFENGIAVRIE